KQQLYAELRQIIGWLMLGNGAFLGVIALIGLIYSHRTVGPLYHFKRVFDEIKGGNMTARVRLRPKDDFQDVAVAFNEMMDALNKK
ncbi:MAG: methyl-accepting chemotaxis protein, partial [Deltaproteobacteria bacterium]|nr:methyl-accepting chemotaxis protein [Deltaproteobacteria bacterium]